jgi:Fe-S-cluster-containing hydrogenase component 2
MNKDSFLKNNKCLKLICGAGNENLKDIEALSYIYASAGFNMIDVAAKHEVINAAKAGIALSKRTDEVLLCISVGLQSDIHLSKAVINHQKCTLCKECISVCEQNALFEEDDKILVDEKLCIGCNKCQSVCNNDAIIKEHKYKSPCSMLLNVLSDEIDCVEFHCTSDDVNLITETYSQIKTVFNGITGICTDRSMLSDNKVLSLISNLYEADNNIIIQADGKPMSGGEDDYKSNVQNVAFAELIRNCNLPVYLIVSGGTNSKTSEFAKLCNVNIDGVAIGSFARKLVKEEISNPDFWNDITLQNRAIFKARELYNSLMKYL